MTLGYGSAYENAVIKGLTKDLYCVSREFDLKKLRTPNYQGMFVELFQTRVSDVFGGYIDDPENGLSQAARDSLRQTEKTVISYIPSYVQNRKDELGIKERRKPPSKLKKFFSNAAGRGAVIGAVLGALVIPGIEVYSSITGDQSLKKMLYESDIFTNKTFTAALYEFSVSSIGMVVGSMADMALFTPISRNIRTRKQHKPFYRHMKELLQV